MKTRNLLIVAMLVFATSIFARAEKTETFKVAGNCGMCEKRIEKAAMSVDGVSEADWDSEKQSITVVYDESKAKLEDIEKAIAKVGHDTEGAKADDKVYDTLHGCCKYERMK